MKTITSKFIGAPQKLFLIGTVITCLAGYSGLHAATIIWDTPATISGESNVSTEGIFKQALNIGNTVDVVLNGVTFTEANSVTQMTPILGSGEGALQLVRDSSSWPTYNPNTFAPNPATTNPFGSLSASYQTLLQSAASADGLTTATYNILNLTVDQEYLVQFWVSDSRSGVANRANTLTAGNTALMDFNVSNVNGGVGTYVTGRFTADATSQVINVGLGAGADQVVQINGYQLRAIPEPSSFLLIGLSIGLAALRRGGRRTSRDTAA